MYTFLNTPIQNFECILQIADIHIRLTKRHDEYSHIFDEFYKIAEQSPKETVIAILGDVFHSKSDLSPECIHVAHEFLDTVANIRPTILIPGNHDTTLANRSRLDCLTPIVSALDNPNLFYIKNTGLYQFGDILFNHMSIFDDVKDYITADKIPSIYKNKSNYLVSLFHGAVNGSLTDLGFTINNHNINLRLFDGHDIALLGDIHLYQRLQEYNKSDSLPAVIYPGSMIQQNHGESSKHHGCVIWNLKTKIHNQIDIPNKYGYYTIDVKNGKVVGDISDIPKNVRLRIKKCNNTTDIDIDSIIENITKLSKLVEPPIYINEFSLSSSGHNKSIDVSKISDYEYQNELIKSYLVDKYKLTDDVLSKVYDLNKITNDKIDRDKLTKSVKWIPKKFEFSNMFSYGEDNVIDFSKMKDVVGLFSENYSGKSSILSALSFCIFDKCDRAFKASHVLNFKKQSFKCKFNFEINGTNYYIERLGTADKKRSVKVTVNFWKDENGKIVDLNGGVRRSTNDVIRDFMGTYEDFILTVLSVQNNKSVSFIDMGQTDKKDLLSKFMGLDIFEDLVKLELKNQNSLIEKYAIHLFQLYCNTI